MLEVYNKLNKAFITTWKQVVKNNNLKYKYRDKYNKFTQEIVRY